MLIVILVMALADIDLTEHDLFNPNYLQIAKAGDNLLVCSALENRIVLMDRNGKRKAVFSESGPGPLEFERPFIASVSMDKVIILNRNRTFLCFDKLLTHPNNCKPGMGFSWIRGTKDIYQLGRDRFLVQSAGINVPTIYEVYLEDGAWYEQAAEFPVQFVNEEIFRDKSYCFQNGLVFEWPFAINADDHYEVIVHDCTKGLKKNVVQVLRQNIDGIADMGSQMVFVHRAAKIGNEFVCVVSVTPKSLKGETLYLDIYAEDGSIKARKKLDRSLRLMPVLQSWEVFVLDNEEMILSEFKP